MTDTRLSILLTQVSIGGKSFKEVGFPEEWEYNFETCCYEKSGYVLPKTQLYERIKPLAT